MTLKIPRYVQVSDELATRIAAGAFALGSLLPTEIELCEEFGVSRHTVREALRRLSDAGLLRRRQGSGSQVVATRKHRAYVHEMRSLAGLFQYAADTRFRIDRVVRATADAPDAPDLDGRQGEIWLIATGLRHDPEGGGAICVSTVYISDEFAEVAADLPLHDGAIYSMLEARFGVEVADVEQQIDAMPMPHAAARALGLSRNLWVVRVVRRYRAASGRLMLASVNYHPGDRFSYTMHLRREDRGFA
ncbi:MAG: GntR family transcriptional regulator [Paracoccaceae bacterium]